MDQKPRFYFVYRTTNTINGKYYIGCHITTNLNDGYLGSGKRLGYSIAKYGRENFKVEILEFLETKELMFAKEKELITENVLQDPMNMNIHPGGMGGGGFALMSKEKRHAAESKGGKKSMTDFWNNETHVANHKIRSSKFFKDKLAKGKFGDWTGKKHKEETKQKIGKANAISQLGNRNSQFETHWIHNKSQSIKIKKAELNQYLINGWIQGRKMKFI